MPVFHSAPDLEMHYEIDDFTDPWRTPDAVLMVHGNRESGLAWYGWVPTLARRYRVVRPDTRGFGQSTPMPHDFRWTLDVVIDDFIRLMDHVGVDRCHVVAAKIGTTIARAFAARRPQRVRTLTLCGTPLPYRPGSKERAPEMMKEFERHGAGPSARRTMGARLGSSFPAAGVEWWGEFMGRTSRETQIGFISTIACADVSAEIPRISCPTLVITTEKSGLATVEETRAWQRLIPKSTLLVLPGDSYHVAVTDAEACARATLAFIAENGG